MELRCQLLLTKIISLFRYDREEGGATFNEDTSSFFLGDEDSFQKKEAELAKRLVSLDVFFLLFFVKICMLNCLWCVRTA